jgi:hypothetical protein
VLATGIQGFAAAEPAVKGLNAGARIKLGTFDVSIDNPNDLAAVQTARPLFVVDQQAVPAGLRRGADGGVPGAVRPAPVPADLHRAELR